MDHSEPFQKERKKLRERSWITKGILQSIKIKNNLYNRYIRKQYQLVNVRYISSIEVK